MISDNDRTSSPMFSIVTVCMSDKLGLMNTYNSLVRQSCDDYEWIVVDGGSQDGTRGFLEALPPGTCSWISEPDEGLYDAMNKGIESASGEYLLFLNSGDTLARENVLHLVKDEIQEQAYPDFVYGDACEHDRAGQSFLKKSRRIHWLWYGMFTHHQAMFYKRAKVGKIRYRLEYKIAADYGFTSEFLQSSHSNIYMPIPICVFQGGGLTSKRAAQLMGMREQWRIGRKIQHKGVAFSLVTLLLHLTKHAMLRITPRFFHVLRYESYEA